MVGPTYNSRLVCDSYFETYMANPISSMNLGSEELSIEKYMQLLGRKFVDAKYNMIELVDLAWDIEVHLDSGLNDEPMEGNVVDDQPPLIDFLKPMSMPNYYLILQWKIHRSFQLWM